MSKVEGGKMRKKGQWQKVGGIVITALLAIAAVAGWFFPVEAPEARVRERISIDAREDAYLWNGADLYVYSDDHSTQKFHVDGATGNIDSEGTLDVAGGILSATGAFTITDNVNITGTLDVDSTLNVDGAATFNSTFDVDGNVSSGTGAFTVTDNVNITGTLGVDGIVTLAAGSIITHAQSLGGGVMFAIHSSVDYDVTSTVTVGTIPANADVVNWEVIVAVAFDGSGTDLLNCGTSGDADMFVDALAISSAGANWAGDAADMQNDEWSNYGDVGGSAITIQCIYADQNLDASAGDGTFILWYILD